MRRHRWILQTALIIGIGAGFIGIIASSLAYMAKDYNAYNTVYAFFHVSAALRIRLTRLAVDKTALLRLLNVSQAVFVLSSFCFAMIFSDLISTRPRRVCGFLALAAALVQIVMLDPGVVTCLYMRPVGCFGSVAFFRSFYRALPAFLRWSAMLEILLADTLHVTAFARTPRRMRAEPGLVMLFYGGLSSIYFFLYSWLPVQTLWISRVARYVSFDSLPVYRPTTLNAYAPAISGMFVLCFLLVAGYHLLKNARERRSELNFRSKIAVVDTVSSVFCHYLKNELLSQQAELRLLEAGVDPALRQDVGLVIARNDEIYRHLSNVRDVMRRQTLTLNRVDVFALLRDAAGRLELPQNVRLSLRMPAGAAWIMGNQDQLLETWRCLVNNAVESAGPDAPLRIGIRARLMRQYVEIIVSNDGPRIAPDKRSVIFEPFVSTKPAKSNWGLGLALCRQIVALHRGRIWVDEMDLDGRRQTAFHMLFPLAPREDGARV